MARKTKLLHAVQPLPREPGTTVFLAGPTPRDARTPSWRPEAVRLLREAGFAGTVILPETSDGEWRQSYDDQVEWECEMRELADVIAFWVPRDMASMPALTTNIEFGEDLATGRMLYGRPADAPKNKYLDHRWRERSGIEPYGDLASLMAACAKAADAYADLPPRIGGHARIPAQAWSCPLVRDWLLDIEAGRSKLRVKAFRLCDVTLAGPELPVRGVTLPSSDPALPYVAFTARIAFEKGHPRQVHLVRPAGGERLDIRPVWD